MSYVKSKKSFEVRGGIFYYYFAVCKKTHTTILILCRVLKKAHGKHMSLPCAKVRHTAKPCFAVCLLFAVCLFVDTRQSCFLLCAREIAHGKLVGTWQMQSFP